MGKFQQYKTAVACSLFSFLMGLLNVWPSYTIGLYRDANTTLLHEPMSELHASLVGSLPSLGAMIGTAITSLVIDRIGRRNGGVVLSIPNILCWSIIELTKSTPVILCARFLGGVAGGAGLVYAPIFISEVSESSIRGLLASCPIIFYCMGAVSSYLLGWVCTYRSVIYVNLVAGICGAAFSTLVVESPVYLLKSGKEQDALSAIAKYRGDTITSKMVQEELSRLKQQITPAVEMITVSQADKTNDTENKTSDPEKEMLNTDEVVYGERPQLPPWKQLFVSPSSRRAMTVVGLTLTLQVFMGMVSMQVYAKDLFASAAPDVSSHLCSVLFAVVLLGGAVFTSVFADMAGRRVLIISSSLLVASCMAALGVLVQTRIAPPWVTAVVILLYCFCFSAGAGTVPYVLLTECFNSEVQGIASMLLVEWVWFLNFFIIAVYPTMVSILNIHGVFYLYACFGVSNAVASFFIVPETKGLSLDEIQESFLRRSSSLKRRSIT